DGERAADAEALRRLTAAGYDPREAARVFHVLAAAGGERQELAEIFTYGDPRRLGEREGVWTALLRDDARARRDPAPPVAPSADEFARRMRAVVRDNAALDARAGRFALAARQLERVLAADPNDAVAQFYSGELYRLRAQRDDGPARADD